jgi:hypothetical protein
MAFTFTVSKKTVFGDERVSHGKVTADSTAGYVVTGLANIVALTHAPISQTTGVKYTINKLDSGTAAAGTLAVTGCTSGDEFYVTVYGS